MTCDHVYGDVAGLSAIYLTDDESMMTMMRASQEQLACDSPIFWSFGVLLNLYAGLSMPVFNF